MHVIYPKKKIATVDSMILARAQVWVPPGDWREGPNLPATKPAKHATSKPLHPPKHKAAASRAKRSVNAPTAQPATQPAPAKKKKKPATRTTQSAQGGFSAGPVPFSMVKLDAVARWNSSDFRA
jgi:hypothetical protein